MLSELRRRVPIPLQLMAMNILLTLLTFVTGVLLARALGPERRGEFGALFMWTGIIANLCTCGTHVHLARIAAQRPEATAAVYRTAYRVALLSGAGGMLVYLLIAVPTAGLTAHYDIVSIALASLVIICAVPNAFNVQIELGRGRFEAFNVIRALFALANFVCVAALFAIGVDSVLAFLIALIAATLAGSLGAMLAVRRSLKPASTDPSPGIRSVYRAAAPIGVSFALTSLSQQADKLLASMLFAPAPLGIYIVAATLSQVQFTIGDALSQMFFARAARVGADAPLDGVWIGLRLRQTILIYLIVCAGACAVAPPLIPLIYGPDFAAVSPLLFLLLPALALQGMNRPFEETLRGLDRARALIASTVATVVTFAIGAAIGYTTGDIMLFAAGTLAAFAAGLLVNAWNVARIAHIGMIALLVPRPADAANLWRQAFNHFRAPPAAI